MGIRRDMANPCACPSSAAAASSTNTATGCASRQREKRSCSSCRSYDEIVVSLETFPVGRLPRFPHAIGYRALLWLSACTLVVYGAHRLLTGPNGLEAVYFDGLDWQDPGTATHHIDNPPSTALLKQRRPDFAEHP